MKDLQCMYWGIGTESCLFISVKLMGINFDNALVNINEFCILTWWLLYNVHQPLKKKKNRVLMSYQGKVLSVKELMSEWTGVIDFMMESVTVIESESEQVRVIKYESVSQERWVNL